jgi:hypothetical protein
MSNKQDPQETTQETPVENTNHTLEIVVLSLAALFFAAIGILQMMYIGHSF